MSQLHEISGCTNENRKADVVFIHGLGGDAFTTWRHGADARTSWPHWIGDEFPEVGVWSLGYAASPTVLLRALGWISKRFRDSGYALPLTDRASEILDLLIQRGIGKRPILLICHSLGGLVAKALLRASSDALGSSPRRAVFGSTRAVLFLATPHAGTEIASHFSWITTWILTVAVHDLRAHDAHLRNLQDWYREHSREAGIETRTYFESRPTGGAFLVVNPTSAQPGVGPPAVALDEDHQSISKPRERDAAVCGAANELLRTYVLGSASRARTSEQIPGERAASAVFGAATDSDALALTRFASAAIVNQVSALSSEITGATNADLDRIQLAWREGRRSEARTGIAMLTESPVRLSAMSPAVAARVLRVAAGVALDDDAEGGAVRARTWLAQATALDPKGDDVRLRAVLLAQEGEIGAAMALLAATPAPSADNLYAVLLLRAGRLDEASEVLERSEPTASRDIVERWRLRALVCFGRHDLSGALSAASEARAIAPRDHSVRYLSAVLHYFEGLVPATVSDVFPPWPQPADPATVRRDAVAVAAFRDSATTFAELLDSDLSPPERRYIQTWRLAALANVASLRLEATAFAKGVLACDPSHPYILLWALNLEFGIELEQHLDALGSELRHDFEMEHAVVFILACNATGRAALAVEVLEEWRPRFADADARSAWAFCRAQTALVLEDVETARALVSDLPAAGARAIQAEILAHEARQTGDVSRLVAHLEAAEAATGDPRFLLEACKRQASAGHWSYVRSKVDALLHRLPTAEVRHLQIYARLHTGDLVGCVNQLDAALSSSDEGVDPVPLRRLRAQVQGQRGEIATALEDMTFVVAHGDAEPPTSDLLTLARLQFIAGQSHEVATSARRIRTRADLTASDALQLAEALAHDDRALATELWYVASRRDIPDEAVTLAIGVGYKLGLDQHMAVLVGRLAGLAAAGHLGVQQFSTEELVSLMQERADQSHRSLEQYRRGHVATHAIAQVLNLPLMHLYHTMLAANESQRTRRQQFALQVRDGGRGLPEATATVCGPGRLAMDLSALLLASHLDLLPAIEQQFAPVKLSQHIMAGLYAERDKLTPHQPSRLGLTRQLLRAEREGQISRWAGELPIVEPEEGEVAGAWSRWISLLERAKRERAFVLDLPLHGDSSFGRPTTLAGPERLARIVTPASMRSLLIAFGASVPAVDVHTEYEEAPAPDQSASDTVRVPRGSVIYLTDAGAEALASSGTLEAAADYYELRVDPDDQDARRAQLDALPELADQVAWIEALIRRVSDGLTSDVYALLPAPPKSGDFDEELGSITRGGAELSTAATDEVNDHNFVGCDAGAATQDDTGTQTDETGRTPSSPPADLGPRDPEPTLPLPMRLLADLLAVPPGTIDAVWIEDRFLNTYRFGGTARMTEVLEILAFLERHGRFSPDDKWALWLRLRSANVRILPLSADEIVHHLSRSTVEDGRVVETRALRVLRQYAAALLEDSHGLRIPLPSALAAGAVGELAVVSGYVRAVHEALAATWRQSGETPDEGTRTRRLAHARWIADNLYMDMGLLRTRIIQPGSAPEPGVSATGAAALLMVSLELLSTGPVHMGKATDARATTYAAWVYEELIAARAARDAEFMSGVVDRLRHHLSRFPTQRSEDPIQRAVALMLTGRVYDALPEVLRAHLSSDPAWAESIGRGVVGAISIGEWHVPVEDFARACIEAARGAIATVSALGSDPPIDLRVVFVSTDTFELRSPDGTNTFIARDPAFSVLADDESARRMGLLAFRRVADVDALSWQSVVDRISAMSDPAKRLSALMQLRQDSVRERYLGMTQRWRTNGELSRDDLRASSPDAILAHLRFPALTSGLAWTAAWDAAAETLITEEGVEEAFRRLAGIPLPLPVVVTNYVRRLSNEECRALVKRLLRVPTSPIGDIQAIRALRAMGDRNEAFSRLARRLARRIATPSWNVEVALLHAAALAAHDGLAGQRSILSDSGQRYIASWYHAHVFVGGMKAAASDLPGLVGALEAYHPIGTRMFDAASTDEADIAHPVHLDPWRLAVAGLQYAMFDGTPPDPSGAPNGDLVARLSSETSAGRWPRVQLMRDMRSLTDICSTWLPLMIAENGEIRIGADTIVPVSMSADVLRNSALDALGTDPFDAAAWLTIELVAGPTPLLGTDAERFEVATGSSDVRTLMQRLATHASVVARRLARQAVATGLSERRAHLRKELLASVKEDQMAAGRSTRAGPANREQTDPVGSDELTETQVGVFEALYLLSQAEGTRVEAMTAFANDLASLGRVDVAFLRRARPMLEQFVGEFALLEANVFTALLAESRGS